jgi:hypothetical protein
MKRVLILLGVVVAAGAAWLAWQASRLLPIGAGYAAKALCSEHFVAGRADSESIFADIRDIDPAFAWISYRMEPAAGRAVTYIGPGLARTTAVYRGGVGCTIANGVDPDELEAVPPRFSVRVPAGEPFEVLPENPALERALDEAFSEPTADSRRRTRAVVRTRISHAYPSDRLVHDQEHHQ